MPEVMIATKTGDLRVEGRLYRLRRGRTTAHSTHPAVVASPHLWMRLPVDLPSPEAAGGGEPAGDEVRRLTAELERVTAERDELLASQDEAPAEVEVTTMADPEPVTMPAEPTPAAVRAWAKENSVAVPARGKPPAEVVEQYLAAQNAD